MRYEPDHIGTGKLLRGDDMADVVRTVAQAGVVYAVSISPDAPPHGAGYIASFDVEVEIQGDRQTAVLSNSSDHAVQVEWGARGHSGHHVLSRTIDLIEAG